MKQHRTEQLQRLAAWSNRSKINRVCWRPCGISKLLAVQKNDAGGNQRGMTNKTMIWSGLIYYFKFVAKYLQVKLTNWVYTGIRHACFNSLDEALIHPTVNPKDEGESQENSICLHPSLAGQPPSHNCERRSAYRSEINWRLIELDWQAPRKPVPWTLQAPRPETWHHRGRQDLATIKRCVAIVVSIIIFTNWWWQLTFYYHLHRYSRWI